MIWKSIPDVESEIVNASLKKYNELPKQGKPLVHETKAEWTVLATIVMVHCCSKDNYSIQVISLGTGLKCLPFSKLCKTGDLLNDSHAEVIARRGFVKYLVDQYGKMIDSNDQNDSPFYLEKGRLKVCPDYSFHMYISQSPCGDASMTALAQAQTQESFDAFELGKKRKRSSEEDHPYLAENIYKNKKKLKLNDNDDVKQFRRGRFGFDQVGILRTKPGRVDSEPTLCMSCSDKLARWNILGLQSALLSSVYDPIYLSSIIIGDMYDGEALERALYKRLIPIEGLPQPFIVNCPDIFKTSIQFPASKISLEACQKFKAVIPCSTAVSWVVGMTKPEVYVNGCKQGAPKNKPLTEKTRPSICKKSLFRRFLQVRNTEVDEEQTYFDCKKNAADYQRAKSILLDQVFDMWVQTPSTYENFKAY